MHTFTKSGSFVTKENKEAVLLKLLSAMENAYEDYINKHLSIENAVWQFSIHWRGIFEQLYGHIPTSLFNMTITFYPRPRAVDEDYLSIQSLNTGTPLLTENYSIKAVEDMYYGISRPVT